MLAKQNITLNFGLPQCLIGKESTYNQGYTGNGFDPWVKREWQPIPVFLPAESHGQRSMVGYGPWGHKELDPTEHSTFTLYDSFFFFSVDTILYLWTTLLIKHISKLTLMLRMLLGTFNWAVTISQSELASTHNPNHEKKLWILDIIFKALASVYSSF